jgi:hypothetical protein
MTAVAVLAFSAALAACGGDDPTPVSVVTNPVKPTPPAPPTMVTVKFTGWPNISGLAVKVGTQEISANNDSFTVSSDSKMAVYAAGVELATLTPKASITLFDLLSNKSCESTQDLAKLVSLLLSLNTYPDASTGIAIGKVKQPVQNVKLADLSESDLLKLETQLTGKSVSLQDALLTVNAALDKEHWTEDQKSRTLFANNMGVLQSYLDRVLVSFSLNAGALDGFAYLTDDQAAQIPGTLKSQGMAYDGDTPVFSWRYGLQRTDANYAAVLSYPLALPAEIQAEFAKHNPPHVGHIGDIDIANGKLYAPIEDEDDSSQQSYIAVFDAKTLKYTGEKHALPLAEHADGVPWVAVDAKRNQLYTVTWSTKAADFLNVFDLTTFKLLKHVPLQMSFNGRRVQGLKVNPSNGMLYASGDSHDQPVSNVWRKFIYKIDPNSGAVTEVAHYDEPKRTEAEGLAFSPDGKLQVLVAAPYTTPFYATNTGNTKPFDESYSIDGDDWNPSLTMRHYSRDAEPIREQLCKM